MPQSPELLLNLPAWAAPGWNASTASNWIRLHPHESTFWQTLFALPLLIGWWIREHPYFGLPLLVSAIIVLSLLWRGAAHIFRGKKPSSIFPALIVLQCAALSWGWTYFIESPYRLESKLTVLDLKSTSPTLLSPQQQILWHQQNGYDGFAFRATEDQRQEWGNSYQDMFLIQPATAQKYAAQLHPNATWWLFPRDTASAYGIRIAWEKGKVITVELQDASANAWSQLALANRCSVLLSLIALIAIIGLWSTKPASASISAPGRITTFLQKRQRPKRLAGLTMMALAIAGTVIALWLTFYPAWGFVRLETLPLKTTALLWIMLDFCYWQGRKSWKKVH